MKDSEGKLGAAVNLYCEALEHFLPALECELHVHVHIHLQVSMRVLMRDAERREVKHKSKAKQRSTPKAVTFRK